MLTMKDRLGIAMVAFVFEIVSNPDSYDLVAGLRERRPMAQIVRTVKKMSIRQRANFFEASYNALNDEQRAEYRRIVGGK